MELTRRNMLAISSGAFVATGLGALPSFAATAEEMISELTGGADTAEGAITLTAPEIAENGNTVPIEVSAPGAVMVALFADGNPLVDCVNEALAALIADGTVQSLEDTWLTQDGGIPTIGS